MSSKKVILLRFVRGLAAVALGFGAAFLMSSDGLSLIPDKYDSLVTLIVAPALLALEKMLRDGGDASA